MHLTLKKSPEQLRVEFEKARRAGYPPLTDLADALYWETQGDSRPMQDYLAKVTAVKNLHPKPPAT